jgi:transposase
VKRSDARIAALIEALRAGATRKAAASAVGISEDTLRRWELGFPTLRADFEKAEAEAMLRAVECIQRAALVDWRAAAWWLERRGSREWSRAATEARLRIEPEAQDVQIRVSFAEPAASLLGVASESGPATRARAKEIEE